MARSLAFAVLFAVPLAAGCAGNAPAPGTPSGEPEPPGMNGGRGGRGGAGGRSGGSGGNANGGNASGGSAAGGSAAGGSATGGGSGGDGAPDAASVPDANDPRPSDGPAMPPAPGACAKLFGAGALSEWVHYDDAGKLVYKALDARGNRIMDFSSAGYRGGGVALPVVPVAMTIGPSGGDDTAAMQAALNAVAALPLKDGLRGALLLKPGAYKATTTLTIAASGVVLRGSGAGAGGTIIDLTDASHIFLDIHGAGSRQTSGAKAAITDSYVPAGATSFTVDDASTFKVGDAVVIGRPVTPAWIHFMGMDLLVRDGAAQSWIAVNSVQSYERTIVALAGNKVTLDIPLADSFDGQYLKPPGGSMQKFSFPGRISQVGVESLRVTAPARTAAQANEPGHGGSQFIKMTNTEDAWIRDVAGHNTVEGIHIESGSVRVTVQDAAIDHDATDYFTSSAPFDFSVNAAQVLVQRSSSRGGNKIFTYATQHAMGPNVVLDFVGDGRSQLQPHQRWATGLLVDNLVTTTEGAGWSAGICFLNRGTGGSGHGWSQGWGVVWNSTSPYILLQKPPGSMIWAIGCKGMPSPPIGAPGLGATPVPDGIFESMNKPVTPGSLYRAQLCERLGPAAVAAIAR